MSSDRLINWIFIIVLYNVPITTNALATHGWITKCIAILKQHIIIVFQQSLFLLKVNFLVIQMKLFLPPKLVPHF
jgi:hypothetical protein